MDRHYAGFWIRLAATVVDIVVLMVAIGIPLTLIYGAAYWRGDALVQGAWDVFFSYVLPCVATVWFWRRFGATPGKMLFSLRICDAVSGGPLSRGQAIGRYFAYLVSTLPMMLGYVWIAFDRRKQGFHDKLAGTVVLRDPGTEAPPAR